MEDVGIFYGHLVYIVAIWYILWPFGTYCGHLVYFVAIWNILWPFGIYCGHLVYIVDIWYILWPFGIHILWPLVYFPPLHQEKIGNPVQIKLVGGDGSFSGKKLRLRFSA
jgi:hypothetical protein